MKKNELNFTKKSNLQNGGVGTSNMDISISAINKGNAVSFSISPIAYRLMGEPKYICIAETDDRIYFAQAGENEGFKISYPKGQTLRRYFQMHKRYLKRTVGSYVGFYRLVYDNECGLSYAKRIENEA